MAIITSLGGNTSSSTPGTPVLSNKLRIEVDITGQTLTGTYATVYTYTGSGKLTGFDFQFSKSGAALKLTIDGTEVIFDASLSDIESVQSNKSLEGIPLDVDGTSNTIVFSSIFPIVYETSVLVEARRASNNPNLSGYLVSLTKET